MSRVLANFGLVGYVLLAAAALLWWVPNFMLVNTEYVPELSWRYLTASGVPYALLLATVAARQSVTSRFRMSLLMQVVAAGLLLMLALKVFYYPPQANFFCALHLSACGVLTLLNYIGYRRELERLARARRII